MEYLPIFVDLRGRACLVVGGGAVAARKTELLLRAGARVHVVAPRLGAAMAALASEERVSHRAGTLDERDLEGCVLAVAATDDEAANRSVSEAARARGLPVNVVDRPALCTFVMPSIVDRSPVVVAISTAGASPVLGRLMRERIETLVPAAYGRLASIARELRATVKERLPPERRRPFWEGVLSGPAAELVFAGREDEARTLIERALVQAERTPAPAGEVYLVGAGPGDPDLLTLRALRLMQQADVVLHDGLVPDAVLDRVRRDAEREDVAKRGRPGADAQTAIVERMIALAAEGRRVLRLKGGDPYVFGRGAEEVDALVDSGIAFQVVPGITAASGCATVAGIPLTHRDHADACVFVTGHASGAIDFAALARPRQTVVVYMGGRDTGAIAAGLVEHGLAPDTPAALIARGTRRDQRIAIGTLAAPPSLPTGEDGPTLLVVGTVVSLRERLAPPIVDPRDAP